MHDSIRRIRGGILVTCQAPAGHPMAAPSCLAALARCAELGGAVGVRANGPSAVKAVRRVVHVPVIGIHKVPVTKQRALITPSFAHAARLVRAGADVVAIEFTRELGRSPDRQRELVQRVHEELGVAVMADVSTLEEGVLAWEAQADVVSTKLSGQTSYSRRSTGPDLDLVSRLVAEGVRTVSEGRHRAPETVAEASRRGAWAVAVGAAVSDAVAITARFAQAMREATG